MIDKNKSEFKKKLTGEPVDWQEYSYYLLHIIAQAEIRELDHSPQSRYFYDAMEEVEGELELTECEKEQLLVGWVRWLNEKGLLDTV